MDLSIYKIDLDTDQPNGGKGESPRSAFTKYNNSLDAISGELATLNVDAINGELTTLGENVDTISGELATLDGSAMKKAANLSDLTDKGTARSNLGLGTAATRDVGTSEDTVAAGNDSRIVNAVQTSGNQTVEGIKTFSSFPVTPSAAPTADYQAANKKYVDDSAGGIGVGQTWQNVKNNRSWGTTYTNTTGKPIMISVAARGYNEDLNFGLSVDGVEQAALLDTYDTEATLTAIVPNGSSYLANRGANDNVITLWSELR